MARRTTFKLPGLRTWVENIKNEVSQEAARDIVLDLKEQGPYWSGDFESAWVVKLGDTRINATRQQSTREPAAGRVITPVEIPKPSGRKSISYTIGNEMEYRGIALDLDPSKRRLFNADGSRKAINTAPQDWYRTYVEGGGLRAALARATNRTASKPSIKGFKK